MRIEIDVVVEGRARAAVVAPDERASWGDVLGALGLDVDRGWWFEGRRIDPLSRPTGLRRGAVLADRPECGDERLGGAAAELHVLSGPRLGARLALPHGMTVLGRAELADDGVSRRHLAVHVAESGAVHVADLASRNGTEVDGRLVEAGVWAPLASHDVVGLGPCLVRIVVRGRDSNGRAGRTAVGEDGTVAFRPGPRLELVPALPALVLPDEAPARRAARLRVSAFALPVVTAIAMVAMTGNTTFALFALLSPMTMLGTQLEDRRASRRSGRRFASVRGRQMAKLRDDAEAARRVHRRGCFERPPDVAALRQWAQDGDPRLWSRRRSDDDAHRVAIGVAALVVPVPVSPAGRPPSADVARLLDEASHLGDVPLVVDLAPGRWVGICGNDVRSVGRSVLVQLATLCGPSSLALRVDGPGDSWRWVRWLPHVHSDDVETPWTVHVIDGTEADASAGVPPHDDRTTTMVLAADAASLPARCDLVVLADEGRVVDLRTGVEQVGVRPHRLALDLATTTARRLARLADADLARPDSTIPSRLLLAGLLGLAADATGADVLERWDRAAPTGTLRVELGRGASGTFELDLVRDGPHALVAGTTGAGKSELLRSWLLALAMHASPEELTFVLIDYKGGSAFAACAELPHTAGFVTDLDGHLAARALSCLDAELVRRERILRDAGAIDLDALRRGGAVLPRLLVVVDEFATLVAEVPGFVESLVGVAQRGRSLGIHLVLATQRPSGAVSENIRANTNLRIALRVQSGADSVDVIGDPGAAAINRSLPGRALARLGPGELVPFQAAYSGAPTDARRAPAAAWLEPGADPCADATLAPGPDPETDAGTDVDRLVALANEAASARGLTRPFRPWPDPLPALLDVDQLDVAPSVVGDDLTLGEADLPDEQRRGPHTWSPDRGPLLAIGAPGSGVTTALSTVVLRACGAWDADRLHVHVIDGGAGGLAPLAGLPHVGDVLGLGDRERIERLVRFLATEVARRRDQRQANGASLLDAPRLLVVVDQYARLRAELETATATLDALHRVIAEGTAFGVHVVVGTDRLGALPTAVLASFTDRLVLAPRDRFELSLAGASGRSLPPPLPGRGIDVRTGREVHLASVVGPLDDAVARRAASMPLPRRPPMRMPTLPSVLTVAELEAVASAWTAPDRLQPGTCFVAVGLGARDVAPVGFRLGPGDGLVVCGPPRTGRSTTLALLARQLCRQDSERAVVCVAPRHQVTASPPTRWAGSADCTMVERADDAAARCHELLDAGRRVLLLVDDADHVDDPSRALDRLLAGRPAGLWTVVTGRPDSLRAAYGQWTAHVRRGRAGVALRPNLDVDGDVFATPLPRRLGPFPPGRACLVHDGDVEVVQLALPSPVA